MAAILAEIKSRLLLPRPPLEEGIEEDPRAELVRRLQEYERFKKAAEDIDAMPRLDRDLAVASAFVSDRNVIRLPPPVELRELLLALKDVLQARRAAWAITRSSARRSACATAWAKCCVASATAASTVSTACSMASEGRLGIVVTFLALLELAKEHLIEIVQEVALAPIYLKSLATAGE